MKPLRVCLDARILPGIFGGVEQVIIGLASGLSALTDGDEEYLFLTYAGETEWIRPYLGGRCRVLEGPPRPRYVSKLKSALARMLPWLRQARWTVRVMPGVGPPVPQSDGIVESVGVDVMHFTWQSGFLTTIPSIYQPHDLQHVHFPQFFSADSYAWREAVYRTLARRSRMVAVMSTWGKRDIVLHYGLDEDKVAIVPWASVLAVYPNPTRSDIEALKRRYGLPTEFVFYPAQTWPHKNHLGLLEALAILRDRHALRVELVCSGRMNEFYNQIARRVRQLRLENQVYFIGFVTPPQLRGLYSLAKCLVFPSKFEGWGMPILEAFEAGIPVATSNVTSLPALADGAALLFDPDSPEQMAEAIRRLWFDARLRRRLIARGKERASHFSWVKTARIFRAHYRRIAGRRLTDEDLSLLQAPPLV